MNDQEGYDYHESPAEYAVSGDAPLPVNATFDDVWRTAGLLFRRVPGPPLIAWAVLGVADLVAVMMMVGVMALAFGGVAASEANPGLIFAAAGGALVLIMLQVAFSMVIQSLRIGLYGPMRDLVTHGRPDPSVTDTLRKIASRALPIIGVNILVSLAVLAGIMACIVPGILAAFFLCMAPYYTAQGESPTDAIRHSYETTSANASLFIGALVCLVIAALIMGGANALTTHLTEVILGAPTLALVGQWATQLIFGFVLWIVGAAFFITVDAAETGEAIS